MASEDSLFIRIDDPVEFRKSLLESSRNIVHGLQAYERIKVLRVQKLEMMAQLRDVMKDVSSLSNRLNGQLPAVEIKQPEKRAAEKKAVKPAKKEQEVKKKETTKAADVVKKEGAESKSSGKDDLADLEKQLKMIEQKLSSL